MFGEGLGWRNIPQTGAYNCNSPSQGGFMNNSMNKSINKIAGLLLLCSAANVYAQAPAVQTCELGDLKLESGEVIRNFRMTYITHGSLNAQKSNAILSIHGLQGNRNN